MRPGDTPLPEPASVRPKVSVVICTYNRSRLLRRVLIVNRREIVTPDRRQILTPYSRCLKRQESFPVSMISQ